MNDKHLNARIEHCLTISKMSSCVRRKFGAVIINPSRNTIISDGYNGGPRGGGNLCGGQYCLRNGVNEEDLTFSYSFEGRDKPATVSVNISGVEVHREDITWSDRALDDQKGYESALERAKKHANTLLCPPIKSGTELQVGCHHAESNAIANAAADGRSTAGAWLIVTGEPCLMCAKLIHHAGIVHVICVQGGYAGGDAGVRYLNKHNIHVRYVDGPKDERN